MRLPRYLSLAICSTLLASNLAYAQNITTPDEHLGRPLGVDFQLADWDEVSSYYRKLSDESPNVSTLKVGQTTGAQYTPGHSPSPPGPPKAYFPLV